MIIQEFNTFDAVMQHVGNQSLYPCFVFGTTRYVAYLHLLIYI